MRVSGSSHVLGGGRARRCHRARRWQAALLGIAMAAGFAEPEARGEDWQVKRAPRIRRERRAAVGAVAADKKPPPDVAATRRGDARHVAPDPKNISGRAQLAEEYATGGHLTEALAAWRSLEPLLLRAPERHAAAWKRIAELAEQTGDVGGARIALRNALGLVPRQSAAARALRTSLVAIAGSDELRALLAKDERLPVARRGAADWEAIARLYDALGEPAAAAEAWRRAVALGPAAGKARRELVEALLRSGRTDEADTETRRDIALHPGDAEPALGLIDRLARRGAVKDALELACATSDRFTHDALVHARLAPLRARLGDDDGALEEERRLAALEPTVAEHRAQLGEHYLARGDRPRALATFRTLVERGATFDEEATIRAAESLSAHGEAGEALDLLGRAIRVAPRAPGLRRALAESSERAGRSDDAEAAWRGLAEQETGPGGASLQKEARGRTVALWKRTGRLEKKADELTRRFFGPPVDGQAGLFAAAVLAELGRLDEAERTFDKIAREVPDASVRVEALAGLAALRRGRKDLPGALAALDRAAEAAQPEAAKELLLEAAALTLELRRDDDALVRAERATARSPGDARALAMLANVLERRGDEEKAAAAWRRLLLAGGASSPSSCSARSHLARLGLRRGLPGEPEALERRTAMESPDEATALDAGRRALLLVELRGGLAELKAELAATAKRGSTGARQRLALEALDREVTPLIEEARHGRSADRQALLRLGEPARRILLDSFETGDPGALRLAIPLAVALHVEVASAPLLRLAARTLAPPPTGARRPTGERAVPIELGLLAAVAGARLAGEAALPELLALCFSPEKQLKLAALDRLATLRAPQADAALVMALDDEQPDVQTMATLGLSHRAAARLLGEPSKVSSVMKLLPLTGDERDPSLRAAAALALGELASRTGATARADVAVRLRALLSAPEANVRGAAARSLGLLGDETSEPLLLHSALVEEAGMRRLAAEALRRLWWAHRGEPSQGRVVHDRDARGDRLVLPTDTILDVDVDAALDVRRRAHATIDGVSCPIEDVRDLPAHLSVAILAALDGRRDQQLRVLEGLGASAQGLAFTPLTGERGERGERGDPAERCDRVSREGGNTTRQLDEVLLLLRPRLENLARDASASDVALRAASFALLAKLGAALPDPVLRAAEGDPAPALRRAAAGWLGVSLRRGNGAARARLETLRRDASPSVRAAADEALSTRTLSP